MDRAKMSCLFTFGLQIEQNGVKRILGNFVETHFKHAYNSKIVKLNKLFRLSH